MVHGMDNLWINSILSLLIIIMLIWLIFIATRNTNKTQTHNGETALELLNKRYAKGEITAEEYHKIKDEIQ